MSKRFRKPSRDERAEVEFLPSKWSRSHCRPLTLLMRHRVYCRNRITRYRDDRLCGPEAMSRRPFHLPSLCWSFLSRIEGRNETKMFVPSYYKSLTTLSIARLGMRQMRWSRYRKGSESLKERGSGRRKLRGQSHTNSRLKASAMFWEWRYSRGRDRLPLSSASLSLPCWFSTLFGRNGCIDRY